MNTKNTILILTLVIGQLAYGQQILIDRGTRANGLWCFPLLTDSTTYLYLPPEAKLAVDENQHPNFSMLRYIINKPTEAANNGTTVTEADGGAIVHFLVLYETPEEMVRAAEATLKERLENKEIKIRGPIIFDKGRYTLVSSILKENTDEKETTILSVGEAPVLEGSRIALSFDLSPTQSKLLMESLKQKTSDLSIVFDMMFSGLTDSYRAKLEIDWTEMRESKAFSAGASVYFVGADVNLALDEMRRDNVIKLTQIGENTSMEGLLNTVYDKLIKMLFDPVQPETVPEEHKGGLMDAIGAMVSNPNGPLGSRNTTGFGLNVGFQYKKMNTTGQSVLYFNGRSTVERHHFITFNAGDLYNKYGDDESVFKDVPLWDPAFQQREIFVGVDGDLEGEFEEMLNSVTVTLKKDHQGGQETLRQMMINKTTFKDFDGKLSMVYGSVKDTNRTAWLNYQFQTQWQFQGGGTYQTDWTDENASMINLYTPFKRQTIELEGDLEMLANEGVRAVIVNIEYPFFDQSKKERKTIRPTDDLSTKVFEITLPKNQEFVDYSVTWIKSDGKRLSTKGQDQYGLIFIDELPSAE